MTTQFSHPALNTELTDNPAIYVGTYAKYNNGNLQGAWIDLLEVSDSDELAEIMNGIHSDESDPEFMIQDFQGFPKCYYSESGLNAEIWEYLKAIKEFNKDAIDAYLNNGNDLSNFEEAYQGEYKSELDFTYEIIDDCNILGDMPSDLKNYFDYEAYSRDLFISDYDYIDGYVFRVL